MFDHKSYQKNTIRTKSIIYTSMSWKIAKMSDYKLIWSETKNFLGSWKELTDEEEDVSDWIYFGLALRACVSPWHQVYHSLEIIHLFTLQLGLLHTEV